MQYSCKAIGFFLLCLFGNTATLCSVKQLKAKEKERKQPSHNKQLVCSEKKKNNSEKIVRVLLDSCDMSTKDYIWHFSSKLGFLLVDPQKTSKKVEINKKQLVVRVSNGTLFVNGKKLLSSSLYILSKDNHISFNEKTYQGSFLVMVHKKQMLLINRVALEHYLFSVLRSESWPGWPLEVNKVFAIASRSYVIAMICEAREQKRPFHVKNTNIHQTYNGVHNAVSLKEAVEKTEGIFLTYNEKPIVAMFDSCCGGIIPAHMNGINFDKAPYLARSYPCTYCKRCKIFNWHAEYDVNQLEIIVKNVMPGINKIRNIKISKKDKAGVIHEVAIENQGKVRLLSAKQLYSLLKEVKSFCFSVRKKGRTFVLSGRGYGHHLGLCQWGTREMVREGWDYKRILQFYYPGVSFMKLV